MRWKKEIISLCAIFILVFTIGGVTVSASWWDGFRDNFQEYLSKDAEKHMTDPEVETQGGVELEIKRYDLSRYKVNNEKAGKGIYGAMVALGDGIFSLASLVVEGVDASLSWLFTLDAINEFSNLLTHTSTKIYDTLKKHFGEMLFIYVCGYIVYLALIRGSVKESMRRFILFLLVLIFAGYWMSHAGYLMRALNSLSMEAQGYMLEAGNGLIDIAKGDGVFADTDAIDKENPVEGTTAVMRNVYFDLAFKRAYLYVNYGETTENAVNSNDVTELKGVPAGNKFNRVNRLLAFDASSKGEEFRKGYVEGEVEVLKNDKLGKGNVSSQFAQSLIALIASILLGIPFFLLGLFNFGLQLLALGLAFFVPFAFILSYIPQFANSGFVSLGRLLSVFVIKAMLGVLILFVYVMTFVVDKLISPDNLGLYILNLAVLITVLVFSFKKRDSIIKLMTAGRVQTLDHNMMSNVRNEMVNPVMDRIRNKGGKRENPEETLQQDAPRENIVGSAHGNSVRGKGGNKERTPQGNQEPVKTSSINDSSVKRTPQGKNDRKGEETESNKKVGHNSSHLREDLKPVSKEGVESPTSKENRNISIARNKQAETIESGENNHLKTVEKDNNSSHRLHGKSNSIERTSQSDYNDEKLYFSKKVDSNVTQFDTPNKVEYGSYDIRRNTNQTNNRMESARKLRSSQYSRDADERVEKELRSTKKDENHF